MNPDIGVAVALAGLTVTMIVGFAQLIRAVSRIEMKMELVWDDYIERHGLIRPEGRRRGAPRLDGRE